MAEEMAVEAPPTAGSGIVRQLPASAEYLPTEEQTADMEFLAMVAQGASRNDEIVAAIDAGQYINVADIRGNTIMHLILQRGPHQEDFVKLMHSKGAAIDYKNEKGKTPLMIAVAFQRHELIAYFIENGADVKALDGEGRSILHIACWFGHLEVLKNLVKQKACLEHLETRDNDQRTPLLVASFRSSAEVCQLLQSVGADISVEDKRANKPAELAGRVGRRKSKELFDSWETTLAVTVAATKLKGKLAKKKGSAAGAKSDDPLDINNLSPASRRRAGGGVVKNPSPMGKRPSKPAKGPDPSVFS